MEYNLPNNVVVNTTQRHIEFLTAVNYLLRTFPYSKHTNLDIRFLKKDSVTVNAEGDYCSAPIPELNYHEGCIRVAYDKNGKSKIVLNTLFHEYKHLLQDDAGYLYDPQYAHINHCIEAQAWADEQEPIYRDWLEAQTNLKEAT